jgi:AcrR family transcriptional regulator
VSGRSSEAQEQILDACARLLATVPLHELSVADVIREAGVSRATFYFYFGSKYAVLAGLVARITQELTAALAAPAEFGAQGSLEALVEARVRYGIELWRANRPVLHAMVESWQALPELRQLWLGVMEQLTDWIAEELVDRRAAGKRGQELARAEAAVLAWAMERCLYVAGLAVDQDLSGEAAALPALKRMWVAALAGDTSVTVARGPAAGSS